MLELSASIEAKGKEVEAKDAEIAELKGLAGKVGATALGTDPASRAASASPIAAYETKIKELLAAGDKDPEGTIAKKHGALHKEYLAAVNQQDRQAQGNDDE